MNTDLEMYEKYIGGLRIAGERILDMSTPCCGKTLPVHVPSKKGETWDSMSLCPFCGDQYFGTKTRDKAFGVTVEVPV